MEGGGGTGGVGEGWGEGREREREEVVSIIMHNIPNEFDNGVTRD